MEVCRKHDIVPVLVCLPQKAGYNESKLAVGLLHWARQAGFVVADLCDVYEGYEPMEVSVAPWDWHPNALRHRLIANRLLAELHKMHSELPLGMFGTTDDNKSDREV